MTCRRNLALCFGLIALAALGLWFAPAPAKAQYCNTGCPTYQQTYSYVQPIQTVYPVQKIIAQEIAVAPLIVTVPVDHAAVPVAAYNTPFYYSGSDMYAAKNSVRDVVRDELKSAIPLMVSQIVQQMQMQQPSPAPQPVPPPIPQFNPPQLPPSVKVGNTADLPPGVLKGLEDAGGVVPDDVTPPDLQKEILTSCSSCLQCHPATGKASGPNGTQFRLAFDTGKGLVLPKYKSDKRWKIYGMAAVGAMPPSAVADASKRLDENALNALLKYALIK